MEKFLKKILPWRAVKNEMYMIRFFLLGSRGEGSSWPSLRIHHIKSSDDDRAYHDHPYAFWSFILKGSYIEHQPGKLSRRFHFGNMNKKGLDDYHRLELDKGSTWTLVFCGPRRQEWGFLTEEGWVPWRDYEPPE